MFTIEEVEGLKRQWELPEGGQLNIGRAPDNDIRIDDLRVSRHHAIIRSISRARAQLENISKGNIVAVNEIKITTAMGQRIICDGDLLQIVSTLFRVKWDDEVPLSYNDEPLSMGTTMAPAATDVTSLLSTTLNSQSSLEEEIKELRRKAKMLAQLCEMSAQLATNFDAVSILDYATNVVMSSIPADCCAALMMDGSNDPRPVSLRFRNPDSRPLVRQRSIVKAQSGAQNVGHRSGINNWLRCASKKPTRRDSAAIKRDGRSAP
jgi:predicted component of type VI protein secretion system